MEDTLKLSGEWDINLKILNTKQIKFNILCNFLLIVSIIICLIWTLEILLFEPIYEKIQTNQVEKINSQIADNFGSHSIEDYYYISMENNCNVLIFKVNGSGVQILFNTHRTNNNIEISFTINNFINKLSNNTSVSYITTNKNFETINVGQVKDFNGEKIFFYSSSVLTPVSGVIEVSTLLLLIISIVSFVITVIVSIILARRISKPLQLISNQAKELSAGNLDINFSASGYEEVENISNSLNYSIQEIKKSD